MAMVGRRFSHHHDFRCAKLSTRGTAGSTERHLGRAIGCWAFNARALRSKSLSTIPEVVCSASRQAPARRAVVDLRVNLPMIVDVEPPPRPPSQGMPKVPPPY